MKCHYEVLGVERNAPESDIKKAYRRLALKFHPDKNQDNVEECTRLFNAVQQAYEVLSDPQERAWYDKHREDILRGAGSDFKDDSLNLMPFFSASCYSGYGDDKEGFYSVYAEVFSRIGEEEGQYMDEGDEPLPPFGDSTSSYETVVHTFYSYWQSFSSQKSYAWEDQHDLRHAPNRRIQRLMEKENRKLRETAKKKTNETVRALVAFVRKRDKRVQAYKAVMEEREKLRQQKVAEKRAKERQKRMKQQEELEKMDSSQLQAAAMFEEELKSLQTELENEFGCDSSGSGDELSDDSLFCPACNKLFKTDKAFHNHQRSKKHRENAALLRKLLEEEEGATNLSTKSKSHDSSSQSDQSIDDQFDQMGFSDKHGTTKADERSAEGSPTLSDDGPSSASGGCGDRTCTLTVNDSVEVGVSSGCDSGSDSDPDIPLRLLRNKKRQVDDSLEKMKSHPLRPSSPPTEVPERPSKVKKGKGKRKAVGGTKAQLPTLNYCNVCKSDFPSRNKLFQHIKDTGHALPPSADTQKTKRSSRKKK